MECRAAHRCSDSARLHPHPSTACQDTDCVVICHQFLEKNWLMILSADSLWPVHQRCSCNRSCLSQFKSCKQKHSLLHTCMQRLTVNATTHTDHCTHHWEHVHVSPMAHPNYDALVRPILIPLLSEVGIILQSKTWLLLHENCIWGSDWCNTHNRHQNSHLRY